MDLTIDVAGFDRYISIIPGGNLIVLRGGIEPAKGYLSQLFAYTAAKTGMSVCYFTSRGNVDIKSQIDFRFGNGVFITTSEEKSHLAWIRQAEICDLTIIDSFSYLMLGKSASECRTIVEELRNKAQCKKNITILILDENMLDPVAEASVLHMADGILTFKTLDGGEAIRRMVRVDRWTNGEVIDENIYYSFIEGRMNVDLRYRIS